MQTTYHIKPSEVNASLMATIRELFKNEDELTITVSSARQPVAIAEPQPEGEALFFSLFGSWQGEETGDELVHQIYSARQSSTRAIDL